MMRMEFENVNVYELINNVAGLVVDVLNDSSSYGEIARKLLDGLRDLGLNIELTLDEVKELVDWFEDSTGEIVYIGSDNLIEAILKKGGYIVFRSGRSNIIVVPSVKKADMFKLEVEVPGISVFVIGDPDSGLTVIDEIFISGYRFGADIIRLNGQDLVNVHGLKIIDENREFGNGRGDS